MSLKNTFERYLPLIEAELHKTLNLSPTHLPSFYNMMQYHLGWIDENFASTAGGGGKHVRPIMCLLTCQATGGDPVQVLPAAATLELVHDFSLVHDDIEDKSDLRRGRPTVWKIWGVPQAINAGDGLFVLAHLTMQRLADGGVLPRRVLTALEILDQACLALTEGQYLDLSFETRLDVDVQQYLSMIRGKTAALFSAAAQLGALIAGSDPESIAHYHRFGQNLGLAFQIVDDILGIWGNPQATGKPAADDIRQRKKTLPIVRALEEEQKNEAKGLREIYQRETIDEEAVGVALKILENLGARQYAEIMANDYYQQALAELDATGVENEAQDDLRELAAFLVERTY
ncbi:MAG: polyprenyl synthetase family protein [Anaerolineales bacterium]|nr:polyprenyl synthetase family protein [Anaerolineales bacterium]